jgi:hypothetical protein
MNESEPTLLRLKRANEWLESAADKPQPLPLLSNLWQEGELAIMFADTGMGKSALAVQIAESLATGRFIEPFETDGELRNVLYLDLELTEKQFEVRYRSDYDIWGEPEHDHYRFSDRFFRAEVDICFDVAEGTTFAGHLLAEIESLLDETGSTVLIIDNLTYLRRSNQSLSDATDLMRELRRLRDGRGISILVLAHTPKRLHRRRLTVNDLQGSKAISNFADSIFAIGESCLGHNVRYIKHLKCRSDERFYDSSNVPGFLLAKNGNFLGFDFAAFGTELEHLKDFDTANRIRYERSLEVHALMDEGYSQRDIADRLEISAASVNRYFHEYAACSCDKIRDYKCPNHPVNRYGYQLRHELKHPEEEEKERRVKKTPPGKVFLTCIGLVDKSLVPEITRRIKAGLPPLPDAPKAEPDTAGRENGGNSSKPHLNDIGKLE